MKTKKLKLPHTLILIYIMVVLTAAATWIIPGGQYKRVVKDGRTIPVAGSYERAESRPQGLGALFVSPARGFGFVKNAIIDQHFLIRRRQNRLLSLVLENPTLLGAGIDEATAILVRPDGKWEILGESQVYVVDARKAVVTKASSNKLGAHGLALHLLLPGDVFDPVAGRAEGPSK